MCREESARHEGFDFFPHVKIFRKTDSKLDAGTSGSPIIQKILTIHVMFGQMKPAHLDAR